MLYHKKSNGEFQRIENPALFLKAMKDKNEIDDDGNVNAPLEIVKDARFEVAKNQDGESVLMVMSDYSLDRHEERIDPAGWRLKNYKKNPVVLWSHINHYLPIGRSKNTKIENNILSGEIEFTPKDLTHSGDGPKGSDVAEYIKAGFLKAGSVGFLVKKVEFTKDDDVIFREQELLEFSIVTVPANPNALVQNSIAPAELKKWVSLPMPKLVPGELNEKILKSASEKPWTDLGSVDDLEEIQGNIKTELALENINKKLAKILEVLKMPETAIPNIGEVDSCETSDAPDQNQEPEQEEITKPVFFLKKGKKENE
jgi:HK97 family phage prohead protease